VSALNSRTIENGLVSEFNGGRFSVNNCRPRSIYLSSNEDFENNHSPYNASGWVQAMVARSVQQK